MEAVIIGCHVEIDDVAILEGSLIRNTMADDLIDRSAATSGEVVIVSGRRVGPLADNIVMDNFVDFLSCHSYFNGGVTSI